MKFGYAAVLFSLILCTSGCYEPFTGILENGKISALNNDGKLRVHFIDVGQGDSTLLELPDGKNMLIDAGDIYAADTVADFIRAEGISKLDYVVATHPHADHIGGMYKVLTEFDIGTLYMPDAAANTTAFDRVLDAVEDENIMLEQAKAGVEIPGSAGLLIEMLAPARDEYEDLNNYSAVVKLTYGSTSFLFMGDAEKLSEDEITGDVSCDVIKVGHHGSKSSSSANFVKRTGAKYAIICAGEGNSYGLPKQEIIERWEKNGAQILRTDKDGTISMESDGSKVERLD